jgi:hypothetical protein
MRKILFFTIALIGLPVLAASPASNVFSHECRAVDHKITGFECRLTEAGMEIYWHEKLSAMSPQRREKAQYEADRMVVRYFDLGGRTFIVRMAHWKKDQMRVCTRIRDTHQHSCG